MRCTILACLIMFQSVSVSADIKSSVSTLVNQLRDSLVIDNAIHSLFENKIAAGCLAIITMILAYKVYFKYTNNKLVSEAEELLGLKNISISPSYGAMGQALYIRKEAIYRVLYAIENPDEWLVTLGETQKKRMSQLLRNPMVKIALIRKQEELLDKELKSAQTIWELDSYADIARKRLDLSPLTQRASGIGSDSDNPQKKEAYEKLGGRDRYEVAFETFSRALYFNTSKLGYWQKNSILFKKPLKQILDAGK